MSKNLSSCRSFYTVSKSLSLRQTEVRISAKLYTWREHAVIDELFALPFCGVQYSNISAGEFIDIDTKLCFLTKGNFEAERGNRASDAVPIRMYAESGAGMMMMTFQRHECKFQNCVINRRISRNIRPCGWNATGNSLQRSSRVDFFEVLGTLRGK